jgi:3-oxoacyl-[acyl-carrier-protein] synthase-1
VAGELPLHAWGAGQRVGDPLPLAENAARQALAEAGDPDPSTVALVLASTKADLSGVHGDGEGYGLPARLATRLAASLGLGEVLASVSTACASGLMALSLATRRLSRGEHERVLVLGVDVLSEFVMAGFGCLHALDHVPCRPFDRSRRGVSLGEGAAAVLLSTKGSESVGVRVAGHGGANDAYHALRPSAHGSGLVLAAQRALAMAGVTPQDMDVIHVHGTGTEANDASEALGLCALYDGLTPPVFGSKGQFGHTLGAAGVLEALVTMLALDRGTAGGNVGLTELGVDARLNLVPEARPLLRSRRALKVGGGFGGVQAALVLEA